jgi:hypothetical protein
VTRRAAFGAKALEMGLDIYAMCEPLANAGLKYID